MDPSKINVGKFRRELARLFIERITEFINADSDDLAAAFFNATLSD